MYNTEKFNEIEVSEELFSLSAEQIKTIVENLEDQYRSISKDSKLEKQREELSKIIMSLENRIKSIEN